MLSEKGKYASATENRRFVWAEIIWPLVLEINNVTFSLRQFQNKRNRVCKEKNVSITIPSRGLVSLVQRGILLKEGDIYSIHFKLIPYMRLRAECNYATAIHEVRIRWFNKWLYSKTPEFILVAR